MSSGLKQDFGIGIKFKPIIKSPSVCPLMNLLTVCYVVLCQIPIVLYLLFISPSPSSQPTNSVPDFTSFPDHLHDAVLD